eukprot:g23905.t1
MEKDSWEDWALRGIKTEGVVEERGHHESFLFGLEESPQEREAFGWDTSGLKNLFNGLAARARSGGAERLPSTGAEDPFLLEGLVLEDPQKREPLETLETVLDAEPRKEMETAEPKVAAASLGDSSDFVDAGDAGDAELVQGPQEELKPTGLDSGTMNCMLHELLQILSQASRALRSTELRAEGLTPTPPPRPPVKPAPRRPASHAPERVVAAIASAVDTGSGSAEGSPLSWLACQKHRMDRLLLGLQSASEDITVAFVPVVNHKEIGVWNLFEILRGVRNKFDLGIALQTMMLALTMGIMKPASLRHVSWQDGLPAALLLHQDAVKMGVRLEPKVHLQLLDACLLAYERSSGSRSSSSAESSSSDAAGATALGDEKSEALPHLLHAVAIADALRGDGHGAAGSSAAVLCSLAWLRYHVVQLPEPGDA